MKIIILFLNLIFQAEFSFGYKFHFEIYFCISKIKKKDNICSSRPGHLCEIRQMAYPHMFT